VKTVELGWGIGGVVLLLASLLLFFSGDTAVGIALLAVGIVFIVNAGRRNA
jgi:hypothetical protein